MKSANHSGGYARLKAANKDCFALMLLGGRMTGSRPHFSMLKRGKEGGTRQICDRHGNAAFVGWDSSSIITLVPEHVDFL